MFNLLAQATTQVQSTTSQAVSYVSSVASSSSSGGNVVLNLIDQIQKTDINQLAKYCLGIVAFIWFVMIVWVFFDARRRYVHWYTAFIITLLCAIPVIGIAFLLLYAIMRPELTVKEWEVMHTNYAKLDILTQGKIDKALPMPERTQKMIDTVAEKVAVAENVQKISEAAEKIQEIKTMTEEVKNVKSEVEKMVDHVEELQESLQEQEKASVQAESNLVNSNSEDSEVTEKTVKTDVSLDSNFKNEIVENSKEDLNLNDQTNLDSKAVTPNLEGTNSEIVEVETELSKAKVPSDTSAIDEVKAKDQISKAGKKGFWQKIINFFSEE